MGYEARCRLTAGGRTFEGEARLETQALVFRGETRLQIPLARVDEVHVRAGSLFVSFDGQRAVLELGGDAEKWAKRIAHPPSRLDKLGVKAGSRVTLVGLDDDQFAREIGRRGAVVEGSGARDLDAIFLGVRRPEDLERLAALVPRLSPAGALWIVRGKGKSAAVTESQSMAAGKRAGLVDVKVVSFSDALSAEKYVIPLARRARAGRPASARPRTRKSVVSRDRS